MTIGPVIRTADAPVLRSVDAAPRISTAITRADYEKAKLVAEKRAFALRLRERSRLLQEQSQQQQESRLAAIMQASGRRRSARGARAAAEADAADDLHASTSLAEQRRHLEQEMHRAAEHAEFQAQQAARIAASAQARLNARNARAALISNRSKDISQQVEQRLRLCVEAASEEARDQAQRTSHAASARIESRARIHAAKEAERAERAATVAAMQDRLRHDELAIAETRRQRCETNSRTSSTVDGVDSARATKRMEARRKRNGVSELRARARELAALTRERRADETAHRQRLHDKILLGRYADGVESVRV